MTEPNTPPPADRPDETLSWNAEPREDAKPAGDPAPASAAASLLDSLREAIDDMTERATPTVREISARVAELTASAAAAAAPLAKKAGDATADASGKLAERSRTWAAEVRAAMPGSEHEDAAGGAPTATVTETETAVPPADIQPAATNGSSSTEPPPAV
jgi:hypothetical protein